MELFVGQAHASAALGCAFQIIVVRSVPSRFCRMHCYEPEVLHACLHSCFFLAIALRPFMVPFLLLLHISVVAACMYAFAAIGILLP